jgi:hypothetical protein
MKILFKEPLSKENLDWLINITYNPQFREIISSYLFTLNKNEKLLISDKIQNRINKIKLSENDRKLIFENYFHYAFKYKFNYTKELIVQNGMFLFSYSYLHLFKVFKISNLTAEDHLFILKTLFKNDKASNFRTYISNLIESTSSEELLIPIFREYKNVFVSMKQLLINTGNFKSEIKDYIELVEI